MANIIGDYYLKEVEEEVDDAQEVMDWKLRTIRQRYKNSIMSTRTFPSADIGSDYNPILTKIMLEMNRMKQVKRRSETTGIDTVKMHKATSA